MSKETRQLALDLREALEVTRGNWFDSRPTNSNHSYSQWTTGADYEVKIKDEFLQKHPDIAEKYEPTYWRSRSYDRTSYSKIEEVEIKDSENVNIDSVPSVILEDISTKCLPECTQEDKYCFLYGKEVGLKKYEEDCWIQDHLLADEDVTRKAMEAVGRFEKNGDCFKRKGETCYPIRDEKGQAHIVYTKREFSPDSGYYNSFSIGKDTRREYAKACKKLSHKYELEFGDVLKLGTDENALQKYKEQTEAAAKHISLLSQKELNHVSHEIFECGRARRSAALKELGITIPFEKDVDVNYMTFSQLSKAVADRQESFNVNKRLEDARKKLEKQRLSDNGIGEETDNLVYTSRENNSEAHQPLKDNPNLVKYMRELAEQKE